MRLSDLVLSVRWSSSHLGGEEADKREEAEYDETPKVHYQ